MVGKKTSEFNLKKLAGEVFELNGRIAGSVPSTNRPDAFQFRFVDVWPATDKFPAWADMMIHNRICVRINPHICKPPFFRLFDCVAAAVKSEQTILALPSGDSFTAEFGGEVFVFWPAPIGDYQVIVVDTQKRVLNWKKKPG